MILTMMQARSVHEILEASSADDIIQWRMKSADEEDIAFAAVAVALSRNNPLLQLLLGTSMPRSSSHDGV